MIQNLPIAVPRFSGLFARSLHTDHRLRTTFPLPPLRHRCDQQGKEGNDACNVPYGQPAALVAPVPFDTQNEKNRRGGKGSIGSEAGVLFIRGCRKWCSWRCGNRLERCSLSRRRFKVLPVRLSQISNCLRIVDESLGGGIDVQTPTHAHGDVGRVAESR